MNFIEARERSDDNGHSMVFVRKNIKEIVFKCEFCQAEMKFLENAQKPGWEGLVLQKKCSKAPKKSD
jgi:hypothetical protein